MQELEIEESYQFLKGSLSTAVDACVPRGKPRSKKKNLYINGKANQLKKGKESCGTSSPGQGTQLTMPGSHAVIMS